MPPAPDAAPGATPDAAPDAAPSLAGPPSFLFGPSSVLLMAVDGREDGRGLPCVASRLLGFNCR